MTEGLADPVLNAPNGLHVGLYERWSGLGAAVLLTGNIMVDRRWLEGPGNVVVEDERHLHELQEWARAAQRHGSELWAQISHPGRQCPRSVSCYPVAPSDLPPVSTGIVPAFSRARALTCPELEDVVERFATTARVLKKAGFAGVQIHGAHGYLLSQMLSPLTNRRTDQYGGSLDNRSRLLRDVVRSVRRAVGRDFPISVKLNAADFQKGGFTGEECKLVVQMLESEGVDLLEVSGGSYEAPVMVGQGVPESTRRREAYFQEYAADIRKATRLPTMLTGGIRSTRGVRSVLESGVADFVGVARPFALTPDLIPGLFDETTDRMTDAVLSSGRKELDAGLQTLWHGRQMQRLAEGSDPDPNLGIIYSLTVGALLHFLWQPRRTWAKWTGVLAN